MGLNTFFDSFKDNTSNNINYVPDVTTLPAEEWKKVSPGDKKILMDSDKNMPEFAKKVLNYLREMIPQRIDSLRTNKARTNKTENRINREVNDSNDKKKPQEEDNERSK